MCTFLLACRPSIASHPMCGCSMDLNDKHTKNQGQFQSDLINNKRRNAYIWNPIHIARERIHVHKIYIYIYIYISGGPLSALTCCVNVRLLSAIKKISPLIYSQSWVGSWVYTTQAMMTFTLIF